MAITVVSSSLTVPSSDQNFDFQINPTKYKGSHRSKLRPQKEDLHSFLGRMISPISEPIGIVVSCSIHFWVCEKSVVHKGFRKPTGSGEAISQNCYRGRMYIDNGDEETYNAKTRNSITRDLWFGLISFKPDIHVFESHQRKQMNGNQTLNQLASSGTNPNWISRSSSYFQQWKRSCGWMYGE